MTRPSFKIDPKQLLKLRKRLRLTQQEVAVRVHQLLGATKTSPTTNATLVTTYQRIERTGNTSKKRAVALAKVLGTTIETLQDGDVPEDSADFVSRIEQQLLEQKASGTNPALERALEQHFKTHDSPVNEDNCLRDFAMDIGVQIEVAHIGQNTNEIARLVELTGWSETQVQQPGGVHGHWLLMTSVHGSRETEIVLGVSEIMYRIRDIFDKRATWRQSDVRITLNRSLPWYHVEVVHPLMTHRLCKFSFVRCQPEVSGLKWVNPHWRDTFWLEEPLTEWAFSKANLLTGFDGKHRPEDVRQLRFRVLESGTEGAFQRVGYSKGDLGELPDEVFQNFNKEGNSHFIVTSWLVYGLARSLAPLLTAYPPECWTIRAGNCHIAILLDIPFKMLLANNALNHCNGIRYRIDLVEEISPGVYEPAPWRDSSVAEVTRLLKERAFEKHGDLEDIDALQFLNLPDASN